MLLVPLTAACIAMAARAYQLPSTYLYAILAVERGRVGQAVGNTDGTSDLGPFQVNTRWGPALGRYWRVSTAEALVRVRDNGCANAIAATAILKRAVNEAHGDLPTALEFYHSHSPDLAESYRERVLMTVKEFRRSRN
jgi:Transglycosylase SLT domain